MNQKLLKLWLLAFSLAFALAQELRQAAPRKEKAGIAVTIKSEVLKNYKYKFLSVVKEQIDHINIQGGVE